MIITTVATWNSILTGCGCCAMPECGEPRKETSSKRARGDEWGFANSALETTLYPTEKGTYADGGFFQQDVSARYDVAINGGAPSPTVTIINTTNGGPYTGAYTVTREGTPITKETAWAALEALISTALDGETSYPYSDNFSKIEYRLSDFNNTPYVITTISRYRFGVPENFSTTEAPRSVWEMQWDEVTASSEWWEWFDGDMIGSEPTPGPTAIPQSWSWAGDMESPWSDWFIISPPTEPGDETRVANILTRCYNSTKFGTKPSASGDQIAIP